MSVSSCTKTREVAGFISWIEKGSCKFVAEHVVRIELFTRSLRATVNHLSQITIIVWCCCSSGSWKNGSTEESHTPATAHQFPLAVGIALHFNIIQNMYLSP